PRGGAGGARRLHGVEVDLRRLLRAAPARADRQQLAPRRTGNDSTMKRIVLTTILAAALAPSALSSAAVPRIAIATSSPLVVAGSNFAAREYVTVTFEQTTRHV